MGVVYNSLAAPFFLLRRLFGTKFYWWKTHGTLTPFGRLALLCVDAVYTASKYSFPLETPKKRVVGHAIDIDTKVTDFLFEKVTPPILLFVGRISPVKRVEIVIETAELLYKKGIPCQVRIVGVLHDSEYAKKLNVKIESSEIAHLITIVGPRKYDELSLEYQNATMLINPSETGGIDKVVLEAMKYGVPPLALRATYGELLGPFGLAIEKQDAFLYAETAQKLLQDPSLRFGLQTRLHNEVVLHHALGTLSKRIFNI